MTIPSLSPGDHGHKPTSPRLTPFTWLPIRSLGPRQRVRVLAHLLALTEHDRYLRFGYAATDAHIGRYVSQLDFDHDEVFGVFDRRLDLIAAAHLAYQGRGAGTPGSAEFGVSVASRSRGRGIGARLFEYACLHARNRGIGTLIVHALTENTAMLKIARDAGATLERDGTDATACLKLPAEDLGSHLAQLVEHHTGELDYGIKLQAARLDRLLQTMRGLMPGV